MQKSHQGRSSFQLREDQVQDLISCRLALFQPGEKDLIEEGGRAQLFWRLGKEGCKAKELVHAGIPGGDPTVGGCLPTLVILPLPSYGCHPTLGNPMVAFFWGCLPLWPTIGLPTLNVGCGLPFVDP